MGHDKFKVKFGDDFTPETVLFPISFGPSSIVLLDILISLYKEQLRNPRAKLGFKLLIIFIDDSSINPYENNVNEIYKSLEILYELSKFQIIFKKIDINSFINNKKLLNKITLFKDFTSFKIPKDLSSITSIKEILDVTPNRASKHDLIQIIKKELIKNFAYVNDCKTIIWGHNMSRLAEEVISLTVKGRGAEIFLNLTDGIEKYNEDFEIEHLHPLRDISQNEINIFINLQEISNLILIPKEKTDKLMVKQKTINEIVGDYYTYVDTEYDNIVSTVVKTGSKLVEPIKKYDHKNCSICKGKIYNDPMNWLRAITFNESIEPENELEFESLNEWKEANKEDLLELENSEKFPIDICYGCSVTLTGTKKSSINWPIHDNKRSKQEILDEFIISDEEEEEEEQV
ncbi:hypothetical protein BN7_480 [Wickerhamomyces ciferrii]|uniref:Cytoplasmic tRNA 2-thiolation protein 2 n=1 Tax=Wickerhamomyces ciferrii (strain ATCC 14091 / BCRC 22168 / CBS 111 / JCM 3599 / NBRC 0793 / NRRL Y-1031 F-60-10) TaxID=1206466 RepID=K0KDF5_WICCF|nr:uncharacterized protein BN7_480 [Wickerhamomyces ciferrii]CCH40946.1 hypothetical protein BN7_480 [Wickerhamomyces ciferrii]